MTSVELRQHMIDALDEWERIRPALRLILDRFENGDTSADAETDAAVQVLRQAVEK